MPDLLFAYRLAAKLGVTDVDGLVDSMSDDQWNSWMAVALIDGWYNGWTHTGEVLAQLHNQTNRVEISSSGDPKALSKLVEWKSGSDVVKQLTTFGKAKKRKRSMMTPADLEQQLMARERRNGH